MATKQETITIENVGPIEHLDIPVPKGGGVVVLHGANGAGKSQAIQAVESMYNKAERSKLRPRDGHRNGTIEGLGVTVRLGRLNTARGDLACEYIEGSLDPSVFVDPQIKDPEKADHKRLLVLVKLAGLEISKERWAAMFEKAKRIQKAINLDELIEQDPVITSDKIRRSLHALALGKEKESESFEIQAKALFKTIENVDLENVDSSTIETEKQKLAELKNEIVAKTASNQVAEESNKAYEESKAAFEKMESPDSRIAESNLQKMQKGLEDIDKQIAHLNQERSRISEQIKHAQQHIENQKQYETTYNNLKATIEKGKMPITDLSKIQAKIDKLESKVQKSSDVAEALKTQAKAEETRQNAVSLQRDAKRIREMAHSTDSVLESELFNAGFDDVVIEDGRMCVLTERGKEPVAELSEGERYTLAITLAAKGLPKNSLLPLDQVAWEGLDPDNRNRISKLAKKHKLVIITAEAATGSIRADIEK